MRKLEVGSGNRPLPGYEHLDINPGCPCIEYIADMDNIPVDDETFDEVKSVHVIEHQPWKNTLKTLKEWVRITKPGGTIHIATPNLRWITQSYIDAINGNNSELMNDANKMNAEEIKAISIGGKVNYSLWANFKIMSGGGEWDQHFACYDAYLLKALLLEAGCSRVDIFHDGDSLILQGVK